MGLIFVWLVALLNIENMMVEEEEKHLLLEHTKDSIDFYSLPLSFFLSISDSGKCDELILF